MSAINADFFGGGTLAAPKVYAPGDAPNPRNPKGVSDNELARLNRAAIKKVQDAELAKKKAALKKKEGDAIVARRKAFAKAEAKRTGGLLGDLGRLTVAVGPTVATALAVVATGGTAAGAIGLGAGLAGITAAATTAQTALKYVDKGAKVVSAVKSGNAKDLVGAGVSLAKATGVKGPDVKISIPKSADELAKKAKAAVKTVAPKVSVPKVTLAKAVKLPTVKLPAVKTAAKVATGAAVVSLQKTLATVKPLASQPKPKTPTKVVAAATGKKSPQVLAVAEAKAKLSAANALKKAQNFPTVKAAAAKTATTPVKVTPKPAAGGTMATMGYVVAKPAAAPKAAAPKAAAPKAAAVTVAPSGSEEGFFIPLKGKGAGRVDFSQRFWKRV
jgi:histone H1/5